jgi:hypothetical protein
MEAVTEELHAVLDTACRSSFRLTRLTRTTKKASRHKSVPWWTQSLTILRKKVNAETEVPMHEREYCRTRPTERTILGHQSSVCGNRQKGKIHVPGGVLHYDLDN